MAPWRCRHCSTTRCGNWLRAPPTRQPPRGAAALRAAAPVGDGFLYSGNRHERAACAVPRSAPDAAGAQCLAGVPPAAQRRRRDGLPDLRPASPLPRLNALRGAGLARNRGARLDAAAADALAEPGAAAPRSEDWPHPRQPLCPARRAADALRGDAARPRLPGPGQPGADPCRQGSSDRRHEHPAEIAEDPMLNGRTLPTRLQVLAQRMARHGWAEGVIHKRPWITIPKKARTACFGISKPRLRNPKQGRSPRQTAHFGIRRRTVLYVWIV